MKTFILTIIFGLITVVILNVYVDPLYNIRGNHLDPYDTFQKNQCINLNHIGDDRLFRFEFLKQKPKADIVFMGSSRVGYVDSNMLPPQTQLTNVFFSIGLIEDYISSWQILKDTNKIPKELYFMIDPYIFNLNTPYFRSTSALPGFRKFLLENKIEYNYKNELYRRHFGYRLSNLGTKLSSLISWDLTKKTFSKLISGHFKFLSKTDCSSLTMDKKTYLPGEGTFVAGDGHYLTLSPFNPKLVSQEIIQNGKSLHFNDQWQVNKTIILAFEKWLLDMKAHGVKVSIMTPLWHPLVLEFMKDEEFFNHYKSVLEMTRTKGLANVCEVHKASEVGCTEEEFRDVYHFTRECTMKILKHCYGDRFLYNQ